MSRFLRFSLIWLASLLCLLLAVGGLNAFVDPYEVFGSARIAGINRFKPQTKDHMMLAKTYQVERARPVTVLLGSSRVLIGLDPASKWFPPQMRPVYDFGVPGVYTSSNYRGLLEAFAGGRLRYALVFLDFENFFRPTPVSTVLDEEHRRYRVLTDGRPNPDRPLQKAQDAFLSLFTIGALQDSLATVLAQRDDPVLDLRPDGSSTEAEFIRAARTDGVHELFAQKDVFEAERAARAAKLFANWRGPMPNLADVRDIVAFCRTHGIALTLAISPTHADALDIYWADGLWPRLEQWKTELASLVQQAGGGAVQLWDFDGYDSYATEPVPAAGDRRSTVRWFWEPSHFGKALGELMLQRMFGQGAPDLGALLTPESVAARHAAVRAQHLAYVCDRAGRLDPASAPPARNCSNLDTQAPSTTTEAAPAAVAAAGPPLRGRVPCAAPCDLRTPAGE